MAEENVNNSKSRAVVRGIIIAAAHLKHYTWDKLSRGAKFIIVGTLLGALVGYMRFGFAGAGIAAFGSAVGVKLFVLTGVLGGYVSGFFNTKKLK